MCVCVYIHTQRVPGQPASKDLDWTSPLSPQEHCFQGQSLSHRVISNRGVIMVTARNGVSGEETEGSTSGSPHL